MFSIEAFDVLNPDGQRDKKFTMITDCFQHKQNEEVGQYGQTLHCGYIPFTIIALRSIFRMFLKQ